MYQIVFTSEFVRNLSESTRARATCAGSAEAPTVPAPAGSARAAAEHGGLAHQVFGAALRLLGAH